MSDLLIHVTDPASAEALASAYPEAQVVSAPGLAPSLTAADFVAAFGHARAAGASTILLLSPGHPQDSGPLLGAGADLAMPCYDLPTPLGPLSDSILAPLTTALFGPRVASPIPFDLCLSFRALERCAAEAQRFTAAKRSEAPIWPAAECATAGYSVVEVATAARQTPAASDEHLLLLTASLFAEIKSNAPFWQRSRVTKAAHPAPLADSPTPAAAQDVKPLLDNFCRAYGRLQQTWSAVLPPHSLLGLKRLSQTPAASFSMPDALWVRIVYDFLLAYRLRTVDRTELLEALHPLFLARLASSALLTSAGADARQHADSLTSAFIADRPYLISRWRWPDRFNP